MNIPHTALASMNLPSDQDCSGRTLGDEEIDLVAKAIRSGTLTVTKGQFSKTLEKDFAELVGVAHAHACSSGSAAVHCAVAAINPEPGEEIITTSITDMGAISAIIAQGAVPVFADVDARTGNVTAETIAARLSHRTRGIVVTHLFGNPCDMPPIMEVANARGIPVIEDCAQAFLATQHGKQVGTFGAIGCFSLQQGKHITTGEGGLVVSNDPQLARRMYLFINKAWGYGDPTPDHYFLSPNYRYSEVQAAVALAQLPKLGGIVEARRATALRMDQLLEGTPGVTPPVRTEGSVGSYWKYSVLVDPAVVPGGPTAIAKELKLSNIFAAPRYIQKPAFRCEVIREQRTFGTSRWPFSLARPEALDYSAERYRGTFDYLDRVLVLPWNEKYTADHVTYLAAAVYHAATKLAKGGDR